MKHTFTLERIKTRDGVLLDGVVSTYAANDTACIFIHGLTGSFYSGSARREAFVKELKKQKIRFAAFNTRGHDIIASAKNQKTKKHMTIGSGAERFADAVHDIEAMISYLKKEYGVKKIILVGHSTGANKVAAYMAKTHNRNVKGIVFLAGLSDVDGKRTSLGKDFAKSLRVAKEKYKKNPFMLMPAKYSHWVITVGRYLDLYTPGGKEDVFQYYAEKPKKTALEKIKKPALVVIGEKDEYLSIDPHEYLNRTKAQLKTAKVKDALLIKKADHGFKKQEGVLAKEVTAWIKKIC